MSVVGSSGGTDLAGAISGMPWYTRWIFRLVVRASPGSDDDDGDVTIAAGEVLDLHKSWHGLHWLICQDAWEGPVPLRYALFGGDEVGEDLGYGSAQVSPPARVGQVAAALNALDAGIVLARYDGRRMDELDIYPGGWGNDRSWRGDMQRDFGRLRDFYRRASSAGDGVVTWLE